MKRLKVLTRALYMKDYKFRIQFIDYIATLLYYIRVTSSFYILHEPPNLE